MEYFKFGGNKVIFVVLGTQKFQFSRLLKEIDILVGQRKIDDEVFAQVGKSDYKPQNYATVDFLDKNVFEENMSSCDMLITHSGVGSIVSGINNDKPVIVVPRLEKYKEHVDDHQIEIAIAFSQKNYVLMCSEVEDLEKYILEAKVHKFDKYVSQREKAVRTISTYIKGLRGQK